MKKIIVKTVYLVVLFCMLHTSTVSAALPNAERVYAYFKNLGYTKEASAAICGNLMVESNGEYKDIKLNAVEGGSGVGVGMCQWSGPRKTSFIQYCNSRGVGWPNTNLDIQIEFLVKELNGEYGGQWAFYSGFSSYYKSTLNDFKRMTDVDRATGVFMACFERPSVADAHLDRRQNSARYILGLDPNPVPPTPSINLVEDSSYSSFTPFVAYPISTGRVNVCDSSGQELSKKWIDGSTDLCTINAVYTNGLCNVTYPTPSGDSTAYTWISNFISSSSVERWSANQKYNAYRRKDCADLLGSVSSGDQCLKVSSSGDVMQVIYPVSGAGYYKMGWIKKAVQISSDYPVPIVCYNASATERTTVYESISTMGVYYGQIFIDDRCTILAVKENEWVKVSYPVGNGTKEGYVYYNQFFPARNGIGGIYSAKVQTKCNAYTKSDLATVIGQIYTTDTITVVGKYGNVIQIIYPVDSGGYKMGWIDSSNLVKNLVSISVTRNPDKTIYIEGESFQQQGLVVTGLYDDGSTSVITGYNCTGYSNEPGEKTIVVTYQSKSTAFDVTVKKKTVQTIEVITNPDKTVYYTGEEIDLTGMVVRAYFDNGTNKQITNFYVKENSGDNTGIRQITVYYDDYVSVSTQFTITVKERQTPVVPSITPVITPTPVLIGDINVDGKINSQDIVRLRKYLVDQTIWIDSEAADLNEDGKVSSLDLIRLRKIVLLMQ